MLNVRAFVGIPKRKIHNGHDIINTSIFLNKSMYDTLPLLLLLIITFLPKSLMPYSHFHGHIPVT